MTLRRAGLDYAGPAPLRVIVFMAATAAGDAPFFPRVSRRRRWDFPAPEVRQDFACHDH